MQDPVAALMHPLLRRLFADWREAAESGLSIEPTLAFAPHAEHLLVVETDGVHSRYSHYGRAFTDHFGIDLTGRLIEGLPGEILSLERRGMLEFEYAVVHAQGRPLWRSYTASFGGQALETWQRLVLPAGPGRLLVGAYPMEAQDGPQDEAARLLRLVIARVPVVLDDAGAIADLALTLEAFGQGRRHLAELEILASLDPLTGVANLRHFRAGSQAELQHSRRMGRSFALLALDIDHFKAINDRHGHAAGDEALKIFVAACRQGLRGRDILGRCGGEEFAVALPDTGRDGALIIAERLRHLVESARLSLPDGTAVGLTVSIGIAVLDPGGAPDSVEGLQALADRALYRSKALGRNRVTLEEG